MNSKQWWEKVKQNKDLLNDWLIKQYRGEVTASDRIIKFSEQYCNDAKHSKVLAIISEQEKTHAKWVLDLLQVRGITPDIANAEERYWKETLTEIESFETGAAIGAHAEAMRLERIKVIAEDKEAPEDIRNTFSKILVDELFHERAFREMAGYQAMQKTQGSHEKGMELLGLTA